MNSTETFLSPLFCISFKLNPISLDNEVPFEDIPSLHLANEEPCVAPKSLANGKYVCDTNKDANTTNTHRFPSGSKCHVECDSSYSIPIHLYPISVIECRNGAWNMEDIEFCYKKDTKRRHLS